MSTLSDQWNRKGDAKVPIIKFADMSHRDILNESHILGKAG